MMKQSGYRFIFFDEVNRDKNLREERVTIMRHDVDLSVEFAYRLAQIEYEQQIKATYFFLISSPFYNICEPNHVRMLQEMLQMGHRIGLHYDHEAYPKEIDMSASILHEASLLSTIIQTPIQVFSYHRPTAELLSTPIEIDLINAYHEDYLKAFRYLSDSNHGWKEGCLSNYIRGYRKLYVLIHPIWWVHDQLKSPMDKIEYFQNCIRTMHEKTLTNNIRGYKKYLLTSQWDIPMMESSSHTNKQIYGASIDNDHSA